MGNSMDDITKQVVGRWKSIFDNLGIAVGENGKPTGCPVCGPGRNNHRFKMDDLDGSGSWICTCGSGNGWELLKKVLNIDFKEAIRVVEGVIGKTVKKPIVGSLQYRPELLRQLYKDSKPLTGNCMGSRYLKNRGLSTFPPTLRYLNNCYEPSTKTKMPALLATMSAPDSEALSLHRTYLNAGGLKADIENCKLMMTPKKPLIGSAVRLFPATKEIGITEGIETAIAVHELEGLPVWAALSTSLMVSFQPPKGIENIRIYCDADTNFAGQKAAYTLANRLYLEGYAVGVESPPMGLDFLDVLNREKA